MNQVSRVNPKDVKIDIIHKPMGEVVVYQRQFYVKIEHIPTGITVTKMSSSQVKSKILCLEELENLLKEWES